jgi:mannose-6-phosphate isomerase
MISRSMPGRAMPPLVFDPLAIPRPWGGARAAAFADVALPRSGERIGEWWLLSTRADHPTRIASGPCAGRTLTEVMADDGAHLLGPRFAARHRFPLLIKLLDTDAPLSLQVHPDEAVLPGEGKTESWDLLDARPGAEFWIGLAPMVTPAQLFQCVQTGGDPRPLLQKHAARAGVVAHLHAGLIHALGGGIVALEIQTSADTTYRIFDWHRLPARELHLERAQAAASEDQHAELPRPRPLPPAAPPRELLVDCADYRVERLQLSAPTRLATDAERFEIHVPLGAGMRIAAAAGSADVPRGHAVLVPALAGPLLLSPAAPLELLRVLPKIEGSP